MLDVHHTGLSLHNGMQNVAHSLIVQKTMQLCWTFIKWDCVHTMQCKTLLTVRLFRKQCIYAGRSSHGIVFTQWDTKRCSLSDCSEDNAAMLDVYQMRLSSHNAMQNLADSLIVQKTMQLCWTFITRDYLHTMGCKTLLTL